MKKYEEGFYYLTREEEPEPTLVYGYNCSDCSGAFVFGFNTHDGGDLVLASDLPKNTMVTPVDILSIKRREDVGDIIKVQCGDGNWNYDAYMLGMANGMLLVQSIVYGGKYEPLDAPKEWGENIKSNEEKVETQDSVEENVK